MGSLDYRGDVSEKICISRVNTDLHHGSRSQSGPNYFDLTEVTPDLPQCN